MQRGPAFPNLLHEWLFEKVPTCYKGSPLFCLPSPHLCHLLWGGRFLFEGGGGTKGGSLVTGASCFMDSTYWRRQFISCQFLCVRRQADTWEATWPYWRISFPLITRTSPRLVSACWLILRIPPQWHLIDNVKWIVTWLAEFDALLWRCYNLLWRCKMCHINVKVAK